MASQHRRTRRKQTPLRIVAKLSPETAGGWAAGQGVRLPKAMEAGRTASTRWRPPPEDQCIAESSCDNHRSPGFMWCEWHCRRARKLGVSPMPDPSY